MSWIKVKELQAGDEIKAILNTKYRLRPHKSPNIKKMFPVDGGGRQRKDDRSVVHAVLIDNRPSDAELDVKVLPFGSDTTVYKATLNYGYIRKLQKVVPAEGFVETATGPGSKALGTVLIGGYLSTPRKIYINVRF